MEKNTILVAKWGYSMILATWVRVISESPESLLVEEIKGRMCDEEELKQFKLSPPNWLQYYSMPTDEPATRNGHRAEAFRIYRRDGKISGVESVWIGHPKDMSSKLVFAIWDKEPEFEDHCD